MKLQRTLLLFSATLVAPALAGRRPIGRTTIANAAVRPHTDAATNEAYRAVGEMSRLA